MEFAEVFAKNIDLQHTDLSDNFALSELVRNRQILVAARADNLKRHGKTYSDFVRASLEKIIAQLDEEIIAFDEQIKKRTNGDNTLKNKDNILQSFCGIGSVTASVLLAEMPELGTLDGKKIAALAGLAPYNADSGRKSGKRAIKGGRKIVRNAIYMAALTAIRHNEVMKSFYNRLKEQKKPFKIAITAVMRKILLTLNAMLKNNQQWNENFIPQ